MFCAGLRYAVALWDRQVGAPVPVPSDYFLEFSDPVFGHRWGPDTIKISVLGRPACDDVVRLSSDHDRRFMFGFEVCVCVRVCASEWGYEDTQP